MHRYFSTPEKIINPINANTEYENNSIIAASFN